MITRDAASVSVNPTFISTTGSSSDFLHLSSANCGLNGKAKSNAYTVDFDAEPRDGTMPDIGADEFAADLPSPTSPSTLPADAFVWSGTISSDWTIANNWLKFSSGSFSTPGSAPNLAADAVYIRVFNTCVASAEYSPVLTLVSDKTCGDLTVETDGVLNITGANKINVNGSLTNKGTLSVTSGSPTITVGGNWHNADGTFTPLSSLVKFTGLNPTITTGGITAGKQFYNVEFANSGTAAVGNIQINNNLTMTSGTVDMGTSGVMTVTGTGNALTLAAGTLQGGASSSLALIGSKTISGAGATLNIPVSSTDDLVINSLCVISMTTANGKITWTPSANTKTFTNNGTISGTNVLGNHVGGTTYIAASGIIAGTGTFYDLQINTGVTATNNTSFNVSGNWINNETFSYATPTPLSTVTFNGTAPQSIGGTNSTTFYNLATANTGTSDGILNVITLNKPVIVNGKLTMGGGIISTTASNVLTLVADATSTTTGSIYSFVKGPIKKEGTAGFTFPVGDVVGTGASAKYIWAPIGVAGHSLSTITAKYSFAISTYNCWDPGFMCDLNSINHTSNIEQWDLESSVPSIYPAVTLYWTPQPSGVNRGIEAPEDLVVAHWTGSCWESRGAANRTGDATSGTITSNIAFGSYSPITLGSKKISNPLPIELTEFKGLCKSETRELIWKTATELNNDYFTLESSKNGIDWNLVAKIPGAGNSNMEKSYSYNDMTSESVLYYRLTQTDFNGQFKTFDPIVVNCNDVKDKSISIFPNPFQSLISVNLLNISDENITVNIYDMFGKLIEKSTYRISNGFNNMITLDMGDLPAGVYYLEVKATNYVKSTKIVKNK
jgi:hypothetical protein